MRFLTIPERRAIGSNNFRHRLVANDKVAKRFLPFRDCAWLLSCRL
jgi:hypothetical protein